MTPFLEVRDMKKQYGAIKAVDGVTMSVGPGEIVGVIGPNGSGKTTLFNSILGQIKPTGGSVEFCGEDITGMSPLELSRRGVGRTFQTLQVFVKLSVRDNLIAAAQEFKGTMPGRMFAPPDAGLGHHADEMIDLFRLKHVAHLPAGRPAYGHLTILNELTLDARKAEITLLIGPNGAGKSTVLKTLFGMLVPRSGEVRFEGKRINGKSQRELLAEGIAFVPQGRNLFGSLSVRHNLELGGITLPRGELQGRIDEVLTRFPRIRERIDNQASTMSGGEQKQLEVGRALLLRPRVLLIDEPSIGLSPKLVQEVMTLLRALADGGTTVLMVEQNVRTALKYSDRALVLEMGRLALDRPASTLLGDPDLNRLFLVGHVKTAA